MGQIASAINNTFSDFAEAGAWKLTREVERRPYREMRRAEESFKIHADNKITSDSGEELTYVAMVLAFRETNPNSPPKITTDSDGSKQKWQRAINAVVASYPAWKEQADEARITISPPRATASATSSPPPAPRPGSVR
jgi:hypothetical protein